MIRRIPAAIQDPHASLPAVVGPMDTTNHVRDVVSMPPVPMVICMIFASAQSVWSGMTTSRDVNTPLPHVHAMCRSALEPELHAPPSAEEGLMATTNPAMDGMSMPSVPTGDCMTSSHVVLLVACNT